MPLPLPVDVHLNPLLRRPAAAGYRCLSACPKLQQLSVPMALEGQWEHLAALSQLKRLRVQVRPRCICIANHMCVVDRHGTWNVRSLLHRRLGRWLPVPVHVVLLLWDATELQDSTASKLYVALF